MTLSHPDPACSVGDYLSLLRLDGRAALVVGAGQGMGRASAHALYSAGARVLCVDVDAERAVQVADEIDGVVCVADACSADGVGAILDQIGAIDEPLTALIDVVGASTHRLIAELSDDDWSFTFRLVFEHVRRLIAGVAPLMAAQGGGSMVFIGSSTTLTGSPGHAGYGAAKSALTSLVRSAAVEYGPAGVRANVVAPGVTRTPRLSRRLAEQEAAGTRPIEPLGRVGEVEDVAAAALFLSGNMAAHITGQALVVDGGVSAMFPYDIPRP